MDNCRPRGLLHGVPMAPLFDGCRGLLPGGPFNVADQARVIEEVTARIEAAHAQAVDRYVRRQRRRLRRDGLSMRVVALIRVSRVQKEAVMPADSGGAPRYQYIDGPDATPALDAWEAAYDGEATTRTSIPYCWQPSSRPTGATRTRLLRTLRALRCTCVVDAPKEQSLPGTLIVQPCDSFSLGWPLCGGCGGGRPRKVLLPSAREVLDMGSKCWSRLLVAHGSGPEGLLRRGHRMADAAWRLIATGIVGWG